MAKTDLKIYYQSEMNLHRIFIIWLLFVPVLAFGQEIQNLHYLDTVNIDFPKIDDKINYSGIVIIDSVDKNELFNRARSWIADAFRDSRNVIQMSDREAGEIIGKGTFQVVLRPSSGEVLAGIKSSELGNYFHFTIDIRVKEGKYKYNIYDIYHTRIINMQSIEIPLLGEYIQWQNFKDKKRHKSMCRSYSYEFIQIDKSIRNTIDALQSKMESRETF